MPVNLYILPPLAVLLRSCTKSILDYELTEMRNFLLDLRENTNKFIRIMFLPLSLVGPATHHS